MSAKKIFFAGINDAGKTETLKAVSDLPLVIVEKKVPSTQEQIRMDYGRVRMRKCMLYLYAPSFGERLNASWPELSQEYDGLVYFMRSDKLPNIHEEEAMKIMINLFDGPVIVAVSQGDPSETMDQDYFESIHHEKGEIIKYSLRDNESIKKILSKMEEMLEN